MPTYTYRCSSCAEEKEIVRKITDPAIAPVCDNCVDPATADEDGCGTGLVMERIITTTSFILKGSGWAKDGYK